KAPESGHVQPHAGAASAEAREKADEKEAGAEEEACRHDARGSEAGRGARSGARDHADVASTGGNAGTATGLTLAGRPQAIVSFVPLQWQATQASMRIVRPA